MKTNTLSYDDIVDRVEGFYLDVDTKLNAAIDKGIEKHGAISCHTCTEPACCRWKIIMSVMEALPIGRLLKNTGRDTPELRKKLRVLGDRMEGSSNADWLTDCVDCVFLEDKRCTIYAVRPMRCRTCWVLSPAKLCGPPPGQTIKYVDDTPALQLCSKEAFAMHQQLGLKENKFRILLGALPRVVLLILEAADVDNFQKHISHQVWPTWDKLDDGWFEGNNPFNKNAPEKDPTPAV